MNIKIPFELKKAEVYPVWGVFRTTKGGGKQPIKLHGERQKCNDEKTLFTYTQACDFIAAVGDNFFLAVSLQLLEKFTQTGFIVIDVDAYKDDFDETLLKTILNTDTFIETSISGLGYHLWFTAEHLERRTSTYGIDILSSGWATISGNVYNDTAMLHDDTPKPDAPPPSDTPTLSQHSVIFQYNVQHSLSSVLLSNGYDLRGASYRSPNSQSRSFGVNVQPSHNNPWDVCFSHHASDGLLANVVSDAFQIAAIYHYAKVFDEFPVEADKQTAINLFIAHVSKTHYKLDISTGDFSALTIDQLNQEFIANQQPPAIEENRDDFDTLPDKILHDNYTTLDFPSGFLGVFAKEIFETMQFPNKVIAIVAARHTIVAISGRSTVFRKMKLSTLDFLIAAQGVGKDTVKRTLEQTIYDVTDGLDGDLAEQVRRFLGCSGSYGVRALHEPMLLTPSISIIVAEAGVAATSTAGNFAGVTQYLLSNTVTQHNARFSITALSQKLPDVFGTVIALLEESTLSSAAHLFNPKYMASGELARRNFFFANHVPDGDVNLEPRQDFSPEVVAVLKNMVNNTLTNDDYTQAVTIASNTKKDAMLEGVCVAPLKKEFLQEYSVTHEAKSFLDELKTEEHEKRKLYGADVVNSLQWAVQCRHLQKTIQDALLLAYIDFHSGATKDRHITREHLENAYNLVSECSRALQKNIEQIQFCDERILAIVAALCQKSLKAQKSPPVVYNKKNRLIKVHLLFKKDSVPRNLVNALAVEKDVSQDIIIVEVCKQGQNAGYWDFLEAGQKNELRTILAIPPRTRLLRLSADLLGNTDLQKEAKEAKTYFKTEYNTEESKRERETIKKLKKSKIIINVGALNENNKTS